MKKKKRNTILATVKIGLEALSRLAKEYLEGKLSVSFLLVANTLNGEAYEVDS